MNKNALKKKVAPIALVSMMGLSAIGGLAWLTAKDVDTSLHTINAGTFSVVLNDGSDTDTGFKEMNGMPLSYDLGKGLRGDTDTTIGTLKLQNNGTIKTISKIAIADGFESEFPHDKIHIYVTNKADGSVVADGLLSEFETKATGFTKAVLLAPTESIEYEIRVWIDENATNGDCYVSQTELDNGTITGKAVGDPKEANFQFEVLTVQSDGGVDASSSPIVSADDFDWDTAVNASHANLTRTVIGG